MVELRQERVHGPARRAITKGLWAFNATHVGKADYRQLTLTVRDRGRIVGGLASETYYGWMFVSLLWIDDQHRRKGLGTTLMQRAEKAAARQGAHHVWLDTFGFQAEGFYKKLGYRPFARLDDFPPGFSRIWLTKALN
jgi:GNAT superfamily N-acetyltransferase